MDLHAVLQPLAREQGQLVSRSQAVSLGITDHQLYLAARTGLLLRRQRGIYALPVEPPVGQDVRALVQGLGGVASFDTAALWWELELAHEPTSRSVTLPRNRHRRRNELDGVRLHRRDLPPAAVVCRDGLPVTTPLQTVLDLARSLSLAHGVVVADSAMRARLVNHQQLRAAVAAMPPGPGRCRTRQVVALSDPRAGSVLESLTRMTLWYADLAPTHTQYPFHTREGRYVGRVDFAWVLLRLLLEADGFRVHSERGERCGQRRPVRRASATCSSRSTSAG